MKIYKPVLFCLIFLGSISLASAHPGEEKLTKENIHTKTEAEIKERISVLKNRVEEIQSLDFSTMTRMEKKALKDQLKEIKKETGLDDRITISVGAAIIILLLLIIIL